MSLETTSKKNSDVAIGKQGMVATAHPVASEIGAKVLESGGNAVDASISIQFALNVVEPMYSGMGGGGFMMVYDATTEQTRIVDSREQAPAGAKTDMFLDKNGDVIPFSIRSTNGKAVGIPGTLKGLMAAYEKWGSMPFDRLINPAIRIAKQGVEVNDVLAKSIQSSLSKLNVAARKVFAPKGIPLQAGDQLIQTDLAETFKMIREGGYLPFYHGEIADAVAHTVQTNRGNMTTTDLNHYDVTIDRPLMDTYRDYNLATMPPPSSGGLTVLQILKILEGFDMHSYNVRSAEKYHLLSEAMHLAYADRGAYIGDPKFVNVPCKGMLDDQYMAKRRDLIHLWEATPDVEPGNPWAYQRGEMPDFERHVDDRKNGETTHFTVADQWGNLVSYTTTIEQGFGTGIMVPGYGFMLNNELTDFDAAPGGPNQVEPLKRPMSSMSPAILFKNDKPVMTVGSPGGKTIIASVEQTIMNVIDYHMGLKEAIEEPRIYSPSSTIEWEEGVPEQARIQTKKWGHTWREKPGEIGNVQALCVFYKPHYYLGAADSTREGGVIGLFKKG